MLSCCSDVSFCAPVKMGVIPAITGTQPLWGPSAGALIAWKLLSSFCLCLMALAQHCQTVGMAAVWCLRDPIGEVCWLQTVTQGEHKIASAFSKTIIIYCFSISCGLWDVVARSSHQQLFHETDLYSHKSHMNKTSKPQ